MIKLLALLTTPFVGLVDTLLRPLLFGEHAPVPSCVVIGFTVFGIVTLCLEVVVLWQVLAPMV
jgi:hypothetical protein